jgi:integrase
MARPRADGLPSLPPSKKRLTDQLIKNLNSDRGRTMVWDTKLSGLALAVYPTGKKVFKCVYPFAGRTRWYNIGRADHIDLDGARKFAAEVLLKVATGIDPQSERRAQRSAGTFEELAQQYVEQYARKENKAWAQSDGLVQRLLVPKWGKMKASAITRSDVKAAFSCIKSASVANQTLAAASAIFSWAIREDVAGVTVNPCSKIKRNKETSRERILSEGEIPRFWAAFDDLGLVIGSALKTLLLLGQRPGEVCRMRREHIVDGWWEMPGEPVPELGWPGPKNSATHRVWLPEAVIELISEIDPEAKTGFVFASTRGKPIELTRAMFRISDELGAEPVRPHDLRRTHGSTITGLGFGRDAMNRIQNHKEGGIASVYDRHQYAEENKKIMEAVASKILALVSGDEDKNVIDLQSRRSA